MDTHYRFRDEDEAEEQTPHKDSALGQFAAKLYKVGAHALEDFSERDLKLLLRWTEYHQLSNLMVMKENSGSPQSVAFFSGRQSVFETIGSAVVAILNDRAAKKKEDKDE